MSEERKPVVAAERIGALPQFVRTLRLVWRLLTDSRVPIFPKLILLTAILYVLSPIDLVPDVILGLGQLDDVTIAMFGVWLFIELCPRDIVEEHQRAIAAESGDPVRRADENVVDGSFRVVSDDDGSKSD